MAGAVAWIVRNDLRHLTVPPVPLTGTELLIHFKSPAGSHVEEVTKVPRSDHTARR